MTFQSTNIYSQHNYSTIIMLYHIIILIYHFPRKINSLYKTINLYKSIKSSIRYPFIHSISFEEDYYNTHWIMIIDYKEKRIMNKKKKKNGDIFNQCNDCCVETWMNVFFCCIDARRCVSSLSGRHSLVWNVARELARVIRIVESNRGGQREKGRKGERERVIKDVFCYRSEDIIFWWKMAGRCYWPRTMRDVVPF